jgi:DNA repair protein RecN (Recombination protein N)
MLLHLSILNFIIFEKIFMDFTEGFNVFTGETGAGKSMIIDSINLLLGGKSSKDFVRKGCQKTTVQGSFSIEPHSQLNEILRNHQIESEDDTLIITREIFDNGRSLAKINDTMVNLSFLKSISRHLLDIHGQYDQQSILDSNEHIIILDKMCGDELTSTLNSYQSLYGQYLNTRSEISKLLGLNKEKASRIDYLKFQIEEIEKASLKSNEEADLFSEFNILSNINDIKLHLSNAALQLNTGEHSVNEKLAEGLRSIKKVAHIDEAIKAFEMDLELMIDNAQELSYRILSYIDEREVDDERLAFLDERLELINRFKRKYNMSIEEILLFRDKAVQELKALIDIEETLLKLRDSLADIEKQMKVLADLLHKLRIEKAVLIENAIISQLHSLNMKDANFKISFSNEEDFNSYGKDQVHFLISTNLGVALMPLEKILSGGEVSRIMLAIKSIINEIDEVPTMIFDEIDTGISGKTAHLVGEKIKLLSSHHQIICVTHSPQIASAADTHFKIEKVSDHTSTHSLITRLAMEERVVEVARLLSGRDITENSLRNAEEMIHLKRN